MLAKICIVFIVICFVMTLIIKRFIYFRPSYGLLPPKEKFEDIHQGNLHAWFKQNGEKVILFCHGNAGNLSYRQDKLINFLQMGLSVLIFDYSGYGLSKGVPNEQLLYSNASMFVEYLLRRGYKLENIIPYGESLGGAVAMHIARKYNMRKVILESALPGVKYIMTDKYPMLKFLGVIFNEFDTVAFMNGYKGQSLVLHCVNDEIIPLKTIEPIRTMATKFIEMEGSHNIPIIPWKEIQNFVN